MSPDEIKSPIAEITITVRASSLDEARRLLACRIPWDALCRHEDGGYLRFTNGNVEYHCNRHTNT